MGYEKYINEKGEVAVLISPGFGVGWSTWSKNQEAMLFDIDIVNAVLANDIDKACRIAEAKYNEYTGRRRNLKVVFVPKGTRFLVREHNGYESIEFLDEIDYFAA